MKKKKYFITGIGTDVGKTIVSAIIVEALKADYWKPIQSGDLDNSDTIKIKNLISNKITTFHPEQYALNTPVSPHLAAEIDKVEIDINAFKLPETNNHLIVEGAGGLLVPISDNYTVIDLIKKFEIEVILVSRHYLGNINHTLLSIEALKSRNINIKGIIFNGKQNKDSEKIIHQLSKVQILGRIEEENVVNKEIISKYTPQFAFLST